MDIDIHFIFALISMPIYYCKFMLRYTYGCSDGYRHICTNSLIGFCGCLLDGFVFVFLCECVYMCERVSNRECVRERVRVRESVCV